MKQLLILLFIVITTNFSMATEIKQYNVYGGESNGGKMVKNDRYFISVKYYYSELFKKYAVERSICYSDLDNCHPLNVTIALDKLLNDDEYLNNNNIFHTKYMVKMKSEYTMPPDSLKERVAYLRSTKKGSVSSFSLRDGVAGALASMAAGFLFIPGGQVISAILVLSASIIESDEYLKAYSQNRTSKINNILADISELLFLNTDSTKKEVVILSVNLENLFYKSL